jgi:hypothetical protein
VTKNIDEAIRKCDEAMAITTLLSDELEKFDRQRKFLKQLHAALPIFVISLVCTGFVGGFAVAWLVL